MEPTRARSVAAWWADRTILARRWRRQPDRRCLGSGELRGGADRWSAAKACVELVKERAQPTATRAANRHPPHNLANCRRGVLDRPSDLLVTDAGVVDRRELAGPRPIHRRPKGVFRHVRGCLCVDVSGCRCVAPRRERRLWQPDRRPRVRLREPPRQGSAVALSASPRARRPGCPRLPRADGCQREPSPRTAAAPAPAQSAAQSVKAAVFFAQRHPAGFVIHPSPPSRDGQPPGSLVVRRQPSPVLVTYVKGRSDGRPQPLLLRAPLRVVLGPLPNQHSLPVSSDPECGSKV